MKSNLINPIPNYNGIGVYAIINKRNGKMYIGSSKNVKNRIIQHCTSFKNLKCSTIIKNEIQNGDTFSVKILEKLPYGINQFEQFSRESYYINLFNTLNNGYNLAKTTCTTKKELLESLASFKRSPVMTKYINDIIRKKEQKILDPQLMAHCNKYMIQNNKTYEIVLEHIVLEIQENKYAEIQKAAVAMGEKVNAYIKKAIDMRMESEI
jgi:group I intron endonuclease